MAVKGKDKRIHPLGVPVVSDVLRAAAMLNLDAGALAAGVQAKGLTAWGRHATGAEVFRWEELLGIAQDLGATLPQTPKADQRQRYQIQGRANRYRKSASP